MTVLLDSGVIFAFLNREDALHKEGRDLVHRIARREFGRPFVTDHVVDELLTLVRARTRSRALERSARRLLPLPDPGLKGLALLSLGASVLEGAWEIFDGYRDQKISCTDASLIATMRELRVDYLATFDTRLQKLVPIAT